MRRPTDSKSTEPAEEADDRTIKQSDTSAPRKPVEETLSTLAADHDEGTLVLSDTQTRLAADRSRGVPRVANYEILRPLGEGTYGEVWLARQSLTGIQVAIKFFKHGSGQRWEMLQDEVKQLAQLHSDPGIVQLIAVDPAARPPYYIMAFVENGSLAQRIERGPLPAVEAVEIFRQVAEALAYVHAKGIRHCDLKPSNILLDARGKARIADFGQAHLSSDASPALGTFFYMAPEQADLNEQIADTRWDVYSLGAVLHAMLTGHPPREDPSLRAEITGTAELSHRLRRYRERVCASAKPREHRRVAGVDTRLAEIIDRCLEIDPEKRFRDAGAVLAALEGRRRQVRQRAFLAVGLVAPVLLLVPIAVLAFNAANDTLRQSETALTGQLLDSDLVCARLAANVVEERLEDRTDYFTECLARPELSDAIKRADSKALVELLRGFQERDNELGFHRWTVADRNGVTLANYPIDPSVWGKSFAWRDWFSGQGDHQLHKNQHYPPIERMHFSQPYIGKTMHGAMGLAISAPVVGEGGTADKKPIVGVLAVSTDLRKLHAWLTSVQFMGGFPVLIDGRYHCLIHQRSDLIAPKPDHNPPAWSSPIYQSLIQEKREGRASSYVDPIDKKTYLAGFAPLRSANWGVIVQHDRALALMPISNLRTKMIHIGLVMLITMVSLTLGLWGWLYWTLRREQRLANA